jgi:formylglycine-generating enzyme required for sulfatase activity
MGSDDFYPEEQPVHRVSVDGFWIDETPVTAGQFRRFVRETNYVTVAERPLDAALYPNADPELLLRAPAASVKSLMFGAWQFAYAIRRVGEVGTPTARRGVLEHRPDRLSRRAPTRRARSHRRRGPRRAAHGVAALRILAPGPSTFLAPGGHFRGQGEHAGRPAHARAVVTLWSPAFAAKPPRRRPACAPRFVLEGFSAMGRAGFEPATLGLKVRAEPRQQTVAS